MNSKDFNTLVDETIAQTAQLLKAKGSEYSSDSDRLLNFKKGAEESGLTPLQVAFIYMRKHYDSVGTYVKKDAQGLTQILSEPIEGRFHDLINYCFLMLALLQENKDLNESNAYIKSLAEKPLPNILDLDLQCKNYVKQLAEERSIQFASDNAWDNKGTGHQEGFPPVKDCFCNSCNERREGRD